jgi:SSS family solute:Na+ symporter
MAVTGDQPFQLTSAEWPATRLITTFFVFFLGEMLVPPYAVRCFIARNAQSAQWGVAGSGLFLLCFMPICIFVLGASANVDPKIKQAIDEQRVEAGLDEADSQMVFPTLMRETFPAAFAGILIAALIAAVMSSGDSCLSCISTSVMEDIYRSMIDPEASDKKLLNVARIATVASGVLAAALSCLYSDIISILEFVYDFWAPTMVIPFLVGLFMYRKRWSLAITLAMAAGFIAVVVWRFLLDTPWKFSPGLFGFLVSLAVFILAIVLIELRQDPANPVATEKELS